MYGWADSVLYISEECIKAFQSLPSQNKAAKLLEYVHFLPKTDNKKELLKNFVLIINYNQPKVFEKCINEIKLI